MSKWADYLVSETKYKSQDGRRFIDQVKVHVDNDDSVGTGTWWARTNVIEKIKNKYSFRTIYKNDDESGWKKGRLIEIVTIDGTEYIKTTKNEKKEDNLECIPE